MQVIQSKTKLFNHILYIVLPILALGILTGAFLLVAHENSIRSSFAVSDSEDYTVTLQDDTSISVGFVGDPLVLNLQPTAAGNFVSGNLAVEVATNSYYGYNLSMSATTTSLSGSVAVGSEKPTIPTLQSATSEADFPTNYWGFKRGADTNKPDANYQPMLANASIPLNLVSETDNFDPNSDISTVTFGVKLDNRTPSGTYDITINFLAVANINTPYYMQNITDAELVSLMPSVNDTYTLTDSRDNKQYTVAKLKDGQYWMTTNLDLAGGTTLTPNDSNVATNYTLPTSSKNGFDDDTKAFVFNSNSTDCTGTDGCYSYYSWNAATAMSGTSITTANTDAPSSICPAGWHLPTSRKTDTFDMTTAYESDFYALTVDYGMNTGVWESNVGSFYQEAGPDTVSNVILSGRVTDVAYGVDHNMWRGYYWSATREEPGFGIDFQMGAGIVRSAVGNGMRYGFSVRCIHNATMQNLTDTEVAAMNTNETKVLYDSRDNQRYTATKLLDGKLWMTKNLNLAGGTTLTSADTDMPAGYTLPTANGFGANNTLPTSSKAGFSDSSTAAYVYNSNSTDCYDVNGCYSYYTWTAATLSSGVDDTTDEADAPYSICPKGWRLPTSRRHLSSAQGTPGSDFYKMAIHYGLDPSGTIERVEASPTFCELAGFCANNTPNFSKNSSYSSTTYTNLADAHYWSSTKSGVNQASDLYYSATSISTSYYYPIGLGFAIRCLYDSSMQNFTTTDASAMDEHDELTLTDRRDGKTYYVAKLKDGNVWMTQNLDFDITGPLDSTTTNLTVAGVAPYTDGYAKDPNTGVITWTPASTAITIHTGRDKTGPDGEINYGANAGKWANSTVNPYTVDPGEWYQSGTYFASSVCNDVDWSTGCNFLNSAKNTAYDGTTALSTYFRQTPYADNGTHGAIGNWYNWSAAVAANDTSGYNTGTLTNSVCPAGWGLPANGKYGTINTNYNSNAESGALDAGLFSAPLYFVRGGNIYTLGSTTLYNAGRGGSYWSGTTYSAGGSYYLYFSSSNVIPAYGDNRGLGNSVRCLLRTE